MATASADSKGHVETFVPIASSHVASANYDFDSEDLTVSFLEGDQVLYRNVPMATWRAFQLAPSAGSFVYRQLRGRFPYETL